MSDQLYKAAQFCMVNVKFKHILSLSQDYYVCCKQIFSKDRGDIPIIS